MKDLREFIDLLESNQELVRIEHPVSAHLEITEITDRISKSAPDKNKALLFENVSGTNIPVLINAFGSHQRMSWALGVNNLEQLNERLAALLDLRLPDGFRKMLVRGQELLEVLRSIGMGPKVVKNGPVQQIVEIENPSLDILPILQCWPGDAAPFITLPQVITRDPVSNIRNVGMYRLQVVDDKTLILHWQRHKGGAEHSRKAKVSDLEQVPAAIVLGGDPASMWSASAPLPPDIDEYLLAGFLRGSPVEFVQCVSQPLEVPANAEIVIEGYFNPEEHLPEGPFGDHTGYYTPVEPFPVFHVTAITHRTDPVYPTTIVGIPPMEDVWMGKATERVFLPLLRLFIPEVIDINMPPEGVFHNLVLVSIKKRFPGQARKVIFGVWGLGLLSLAKTIIVFDEWVDVQNLSQAAWQALGNVDWSRDVVHTDGPVDHLDHASYQHSYGGKIGIDATAKLPEEGYPREWPQVVQMDKDVKEKIDQIWNDLGL
ncbi:MAG: menaquinone biosynthesis decarboxylase [Anaerolineales bacterium]|nr:menaquinone biosynthesis decarboxylase [Anaerolineales bacterium]